MDGSTKYCLPRIRGRLAVWLIGLAWALIVVIKAKGTKRENEAMKKLIRQQNDVLTVTLNRERKLKEQMKEEKHG